MENYRKILMLSLMIIFILGTIGCSNLNDIVTDTATQTTDSPDKLLKMAYHQLAVFTKQGNSFALFEHPTDEMQFPRYYDWGDDETWRKLHRHTWDSNLQDISGAWDDLNRGHASANEVIRNPKANKKQIAEAKFLRAFYMYYLVDLFGQVLFKDLSNPNALPIVLSRKEATSQILTDLNSSVTDLDVATASNTGTATKESAAFLLAKMYLNKAVFTQNPENPAGPFTFSKTDMDAVISNTDVIINSGRYSFTSNYFDNFHWNNTIKSKELIFVIQNEAGKSLDNGTSVSGFYFGTLHYYQSPGGWNGFTTLADFYNSFENNDSRKGAEIPGLTDKKGLRAGFLIGQQYGEGGIALKDRNGDPLIFTADVNFDNAKEAGGIRVIKYLPDLNNAGSPGNDYVLFRYADAWLMKAEALFRTGNSASALSMINSLRVTRGAKTLSNLTEADILSERGRELYWEGLRRNDQIRFGKFLEPVQNRATTTLPFRVVFPIPKKELDINPSMKQNFGYPTQQP